MKYRGDNKIEHYSLPETSQGLNESPPLTALPDLVSARTDSGSGSRHTVPARRGRTSGPRVRAARAVSTPVTGWAGIAEAYRPAVMQTEEWHPKVSVCIVADQVDSVPQATIDSVLAQRFDDLEIVIVATDGTSLESENVLAGKDRVRVIRTGTAVPLAAGFNLAVRHSRGRFVKLLRAGATLHPGCIEAQARVLDLYRDVALVAVGTQHIRHNGQVSTQQPGYTRVIGVRSGQRVVKAIVRSGGNPIGSVSAAMFRRAGFERCGGFRENGLEWPELDLWTRLLRRGDFVGMSESLACLSHPRGSNYGPASLLLYLAGWIEFCKSVATDPVWRLSPTDRAVGYANWIRSNLRGNRYGLLDEPRVYRGDVVGC